MNTEPKTMKFSIESTAKPVEKDGKTVVEMETTINADVKNACTEQLVGLLAYLGEECVKKTSDEFKDRDEKPQIQEVAEEFESKREVALTTLRTVLAQAMLKEMMETMGELAVKKTKGESEAPDGETDEEPAPDATVNININVKKEDK